MNWYYCLSSIALFFCIVTSAVIPYAVAYRLGEKRCLILYDLHADFEGASLSKKQVSAVLAAGKKRGAHFITEDMFDYRGNDDETVTCLCSLRESILNGFILFDKATIVQYSGMFGFVEHCLENASVVVNVEFRHAHIVHSTLTLQGNMHEATRAFGLVCRAFRKAFSEVERYNDDPQLNAYYNSLLSRVHESLTYLNENYYKKPLNAEQKKIIFDHYWTCMVLLLDARIAHQWYVQAQHDAPVIIYVGGEHAQAIELVLLDRGYVKVADQGEKSIVAYGQWYRTAFHDIQVSQTLNPLTLVLHRIKMHSMRKKYIRMHREAIIQARNISITTMIRT